MSGQPMPSDNSSNDDERSKRVRGTVTLDATELKQLRIMRNLSQEDLAAKAGISLRTVNRAEAGELIEKKSAERIAKALDRPLPLLLQQAPPLAQATQKTPSQGREHLEIVLEIDPNEYDEATVMRFVAKAVEQIKMDANTTKPVWLLKLIPGSIRIILEVDKADGDKILEAFQKGELAYLGITSVKRVPPRRNSNYIIAFSLLSILCAPFSLVPAMAIPACGLGMVLGIIGMWFARQRKIWWLLAGVAVSINTAILAFILMRALGGNHKEGSTAPGTLPQPINTKVADAVVKPVGAPPPEPSGKPIASQPWGKAGFLFPAKVTIKGGLGDTIMTVKCWDDPSAKTITLAVNNQKFPEGGFAVYQELLGKATLLSATYYPADADGRLQKGIDFLLETMLVVEEGEGANRLIRYYAGRNEWDKGGEWRLIYRYPE